MAAQYLLSALHEDDDAKDNPYETSILTRVTRNRGRRSQGAKLTAPDPPEVAKRPRRPTNTVLVSPKLFKRQKLAITAAEDSAAAGLLDTQAIRPAANSEGIDTSSANDGNITDTMARMQRHLEDQESFKDISASVRKKIVKCLKSSFGNRYKGRCSESEKQQYILLWVKLAGVHNDLLSTEAEKESHGVKINPKWLKQGSDVVELD